MSTSVEIDGVPVIALHEDDYDNDSGGGGGGGGGDDISDNVEVRDRLRLPLIRSLSEPGNWENSCMTVNVMDHQQHNNNNNNHHHHLVSPVSLTTVTGTLTVSASKPIAVQPNKKCKLELSRPTASLPPSPCSDSRSMSETGKAILCRDLKTVRCTELASKVRRSRPKSLVLLDCRPFIAYNMGHIRGAINVNCSDRFNRKRLQLGKANLVDFLSSKEDKDLFRKRTCKEVIVYDDSTTDSENVAFNQPLITVLCALIDNGKEPVLLQGGLKEFKSQYPDLCENALLKKHQQQSTSPVTSSVRYLGGGGDGCCPMTPCDDEPDIENMPATEVLPRLFLGNEKDAADLKGLQNRNIRWVLNVTAHLPGFHENRGIHYKRLPASDSTHQNLKQYFEEAFDFIDKAQKSSGNILIHCQAGVSRSATITIAYIMRQMKATMIDAYKLVKSKRPIISPNLNFMGQLLEYEQFLTLNNSPSPPEASAELKPCRQEAWAETPSATCTVQP